MPLLPASLPHTEGLPEDRLRPQEEDFPNGRSLSPPLASWFLSAKGEVSSLGPDPCLTLEPAGQIFTYRGIKSTGLRVR